MQRITGFVVLVCLVLSGQAVGDTVYLRDGKTLIGEVTEKDGKYLVKLAYGTIQVEKSKVIHVEYGKGTAAPQTRPVDDDKRPGVDVQPSCRWRFSEATLPEPIVFMTTRQLELLGDSAPETLENLLKQWRIAAHDGKRKCGLTWLAKARQRQRRIAFEKHLRQAFQFEKEANSIRGKKSSDRAKKKKLMLKAEQESYVAAKNLPDPLLRNFLTAVLDLRNRKYKEAEQLFRKCIKSEPLVAAFHQGRGYALMKLKQPLRALEEFVVCLELRDDTYEAIGLIESAMEKVPGAKVGDPVYVKAKELLGRYEKRGSTFRTSGTGVSWLMPGKAWQSRRGVYYVPRRPNSSDRRREKRRQDERFRMLEPPYERIISKQALAIPIAESALLVDKDAIAGAHLLYVQIAPNVLVRAAPSRRRTYRPVTGKADLPLVIIRTRGVTFTPVDLEKMPAVKTDQEVTIRAVNLYRQMGTEIRTGIAKVASAGKDGGVTLSSRILPGEVVGAVLLEEAFAGLLTARTRPEIKDCGKSVFIGPKDLAAWIKPLKRSLNRRLSYGYGGPKLKKDAPKKEVKGQVFLVHILLGEKPPLREEN